MTIIVQGGLSNPGSIGLAGQDTSRTWVHGWGKDGENTLIQGETLPS